MSYSIGKKIKSYLAFINRSMVSRVGVSTNLALKECSSDFLFSIQEVCQSFSDKFMNGLGDIVEIYQDRFSSLYVISRQMEMLNEIQMFTFYLMSTTPMSGFLLNTGFAMPIVKMSFNSVTFPNFVRNKSK